MIFQIFKSAAKELTGTCMFFVRSFEQINAKYALPTSDNTNYLNLMFPLAAG